MAGGTPKVTVVPDKLNCMPVGVPPYTGSNGVTGRNINIEPGSGTAVIEKTVLFPSTTPITLSMTHPIQSTLYEAKNGYPVVGANPIVIVVPLIVNSIFPGVAPTLSNAPMPKQKSNSVFKSGV